MDRYEGWTYEERLADIDQRVESGELDPETARKCIDAMSEAQHYTDIVDEVYYQEHEHQIGRMLMRHEITAEEAYDMIDGYHIIGGDIDGSS